MNGILISAQIGSIRTLKDGSVSISFETQEVSPGKAAELFSLRNKIACLYVSAHEVSNSEQKIIDKMEPEMKQKSPSLRLRHVLFRCFEQNPEGYPDSESYYRGKMEKIIDTYKSELS